MSKSKDIEFFRTRLHNAEDEIERLRGYLKDVRLADFPGPLTLYKELHPTQKLKIVSTGDNNRG